MELYEFVIINRIAQLAKLSHFYLKMEHPEATAHLKRVDEIAQLADALLKGGFREKEKEEGSDTP